MESKCKNCMRYYPAPWHSDGTKGCCDQSGELKVYSREDECDCGKFLEMPKMERLARRINHRLHNWVRERDTMFCRSMEIVGHICELFKQGEFKVFDAVKSVTDMKHMMYHGAATEISVHRAWTYHCPWNDDIEHYIAITTAGKMICNFYDDTQENARFITETYDIENEYDECDKMVDRIREYCVLKVLTISTEEIEVNKCVEEVPNAAQTVCW